MVAVAPALPKQPASPGARAPKSTGTADFGRLLQEAGGSEPAAPEQSPTPPAPEDRAPPAEEAPPKEGEAAPKAVENAPEPDENTPAARQGEQVKIAPLPAQSPGAAALGQAIAPAPTPAEPAAGAAPAPAAPAAVPLKGWRPAEAEQTETPAGADQTLPLELEIAPEVPAPARAALPSPTLAPPWAADLLAPAERLHPDLREVAPEPVLDQLQQAMNSALLEESSQLVMPQVVRGLATLVKEGVAEMRLQLMPEDLGEIELRVRTSDGVVRAEMLVQNPEVKQLLDQHLDRLRGALHQQGLDLRGFDIGLAADGRFPQPDRSRHGASPQDASRRSPASPTETAAPALAPRGALAVDYLA